MTRPPSPDVTCSSTDRTARAVLITGASSGIGRSLALACADAQTQLHLSGRDRTRLERTARACRARGASVAIHLIDVSDAAAMNRWIGNLARLDLVFANAGIAAGTADGKRESERQVRAIFETNLIGAINTVLPALELMEAQPAMPGCLRGRVAVISSMAAFLAYPGVPSYSASKAAVDYWTIATAPAARARGVQLTSVCPGFIESNMTAGNRFRMPGLIDADQAAARILLGVLAGKRRIVFPWWMALGARTMQLLPPSLSTRLLASQATMAPLPD